MSLSQLHVGEVLTTCCDERVCCFVALLGEFLQYLHGVSVLKGVVGSRSCLCFKEYFLDVSQRVEAHLVACLHGCLDVFAYSFKECHNSVCVYCLCIVALLSLQPLLT